MKLEEKSGSRCGTVEPLQRMNLQFHGNPQDSARFPCALQGILHGIKLAGGNVDFAADNCCSEHIVDVRQLAIPTGPAPFQTDHKGAPAAPFSTSGTLDPNAAASRIARSADAMNTHPGPQLPFLETAIASSAFDSGCTI
ncbi:hypothetical protein [Arthrobacter sp. TWP1-1]|uniref:hypothetical protein n=1 Tax=Arthrobacter sp. TWP1-1 TaxID=2804568 RepID=UPI003CF00FB7